MLLTAPDRHAAEERALLAKWLAEGARIDCPTAQQEVSIDGTREPHPVDEVLRPAKLFLLGRQHLLVMVGIVAATGITILAGVCYVNREANPYIIAIDIGFGMIPLVAPNFFHRPPKALSPLLHSGILLSSTSAVVLNIHFNGVKPQSDAEREAREGTLTSDSAGPLGFAALSRAEFERGARANTTYRAKFGFPRIAELARHRARDTVITEMERRAAGADREAGIEAALLQVEAIKASRVSTLVRET